MCYHAKNHPDQSWIYEGVPLSNVRSTDNLLARVMVAKFEDEGHPVECIRSTPVVQNDPNWRCWTWVAQVLSRIDQDGTATGTVELDWGKIEAVACEYVRSKTEAGRYLNDADMGLPKPTYDIIQGKEIFP